MTGARSYALSVLSVGMLLTVGCAVFDRSPKVEAAPVVSASAAGPIEAPPAHAAPSAASASEPPSAKERGAAAPGLAASPAAQGDAPSKRQPVNAPAATASKAPAKPASAPQTNAPTPKTPAAPATPPAPTAKAEAPASLDLKSLETRLKETKAIGVFTKLTLKNQIDELLDRFRSYYQGQLKTSLAELRRSFDLLVLKTLALLQDTDPPLASAIASSRESIWGILSDPKKFATV